MIVNDIARDKTTRACLLLKIKRPATEEEINANAVLGVEKCPPRGLSGCVGGGGLRWLDLRIVKRPRHIRGPLVSGKRPFPLKGRVKLALQIARDFAGSADEPPVDADGTPGFLFVVIAERDRELVADRLIVGRNDDKRVVGLGQKVTLRLEREGNGDDRRERRQHTKNPEPHRIIPVSLIS